MYFQHDGAPRHTAHRLTEFLNQYFAGKMIGAGAANLRWERFKQTCRNRSVVGAGRETTFCYHSELRSERVKSF
ncbi:hypothetical protein J6590_087186 [Homalodisca vitripennis]|nr:hypothetical protein J6590_087186 [Homalodisca vitripennis]